MKKIITAAAFALLSLSVSAYSTQHDVKCIELTISNIKSIYDAKEDVLVKNPYIKNVCVGITFSENDNGRFDDYYRSIGVSNATISKSQGDYQRAIHAQTASGHIFQKIIYVTNGERAKVVSGGFGERKAGRKKREEIMFYHEVSHLVKDSLSKDEIDVDSRELETMADISALYIYAHVNSLSEESFNDEVYHLFRDRQNSASGKGYSWYHKGIWLSFLNDTDNFESVDTTSLSGVYEYIYDLRLLSDQKPKDLLSMFSAMF